MKKNISSGAEARIKMISGVDKIADVVKSTLGPGGHTVIIEDHPGMKYPIVIKDGVKVARQIELIDPVENAVAGLMKQASEKTVTDAGDGTTTAMILAQAIIHNTVSVLDMNPTLNIFQINDEISEAVIKVKDYIASLSTPFDNDWERLLAVANIASNGDMDIANMVVELIKKVGVKGVINIQETNLPHTTVETPNGMKYYKGVMADQFLNTKDGKAVFHDPYLLLCDQTITHISDIMGLIELVMQKEKRPLVVICPEMNGEALSIFLRNVIEIKAPLCVVRCPSYTRTFDFLADIATLTGATVISDKTGYSPKTCTISQLGKCKEFVADRFSTTIIGGMGDKIKIEARVKDLDAQLIQTTEDMEKEEIRHRIANLSAGVSLIKVGGVTETEMKERMERIDDALCAAKASIEEGTVAGGGTAYASWCMYATNDASKGEMILKTALLEPFFTLIRNTGVHKPLDLEFMLAEFKNKNSISENINVGYNAKTKQFEDLSVSGVIDPAKVLRVALENAASVAKIILTTYYAITNAQ